MEYNLNEVEICSEDADFHHRVFTIRGEGGTSAERGADLFAALWEQGREGQVTKTAPCGENETGIDTKRGQVGGVLPRSRPLLLYLHTNTRCLLDAKEVLPLCDVLGASLLAFDLPGCGKSEGFLSFQMTQDLHRVVKHATKELGFREIVLWARGLVGLLGDSISVV